MTYTIRPYRPSDQATCLVIFASNVPTFFAPFEQAEFATFLADNAYPYLIIENEQGNALACGGYAFKAESAILCWGMVARTHHRQGLGTLLLEARLQEIRLHSNIQNVRIKTSQLSTRFFTKAGFTTRTITRDGFAPGIDLYDMVLPLK